MATDYYLQIDGVKGESQDSKHRDWIEAMSVTWSIKQPKSATASTSGGHTAERAELDDINITKLVDLSSPILMQACAAGKTFPKVRIEFFRADGDERVKYFEVELTNALIAHIAPSFSGGSPVEHIGLKFAKVVYRYTQQKISGGAGGSTVGGWDLTTNRVTM